MKTVPYLGGKADGLLYMAEVMAGGDSNGAIERQERRGGEALVESDVLPVEGSELYAPLGIEVLGPVEGDPLFVEVRLPEGWTRRMGDNPYGYWTHVVDESGADRLAVFYKAAFYDRRASASLA